MSSAEFQVAVSLSLFLGAILGVLFCTYTRARRNRLVPDAAAFQVCLELREQLESLQQTLLAGASYAPPPARNEVPARFVGRQRPASPSGAATLAEAVDEPVSSTRNPPNLAAWRRLERPSAPAQAIARHAWPAETEIVAPVRRRPRTAERPAAIDARTAQEIVLRHFGVSVAPMPHPAVAAGAGQSDKVIPMPPAHTGATQPEKWHSLAL